jgi:uncharacterized RDD family membrane protein YckC
MAQGPYSSGPYQQPGYGGPAYGPGVDPRWTEGAIGRRFLAYLIDLVMIAIFTVILWFVIGLVGVVTFGLGWVLYAILPLSAVIYSAITVGGSHQSTIGMRMLGLRVAEGSSGGPVGMLTAAVHALLFYLAAGTFVLLCLDVVVGIARSDRRMGHDLLAGVVLVRSS